MALKKIERKISWNLYINAFVISLIIFGAGIWFGIQIEKAATAQISERIENVGEKISTLSVLMLLENEKEYCPYLKEQMMMFERETYQLGEEIEYMEEKKGGNEIIKIEYMELEFRDYLLSKKMNQICNERQNLILYFVNSENCEICRKQGDIITSIRKRTNTKVYTFDMAINSSLVEILKRKYRIDTVPSIVINDEIYSGFMDEEAIISKLK
ncbi:MAG: hypothetical protein NZ903_02640 [Candidatus Micrarchaeota archaeon]|nr:hypothetical protein [Candidatus Micrarchaeota archaeon]